MLLCFSIGSLCFAFFIIPGLRSLHWPLKPLKVPFSEVTIPPFRAPGLQAESNFVGNLGLPIFIKNDGRKGQLYHS